jgi:hypothetical protein
MRIHNNPLHQGMGYLNPDEIPSFTVSQVTHLPEVQTGPPEMHIARWAVPFLVSAVAAKQTASAMTSKAAAKQVSAAADAAIAGFLDDYCTPPFPWPYPGPPPWVSIIATQLTESAGTLQAGDLQRAVLQLAGQVFDKAFGDTGITRGGA